MREHGRVLVKHCCMAWPVSWEMRKAIYLLELVKSMTDEALPPPE